MTMTALPPVSEVSRDAIIATSEEMLARPDRPIRAEEYLFRIRALDLDWDIGGAVYEPENPADAAVGADGKKVGFFLLHGGAGHHHAKDGMARFLAAKLGYKVVSMTYPGRLYLLDPSHQWPGDTINPDGSVRTPLWTAETRITPDQYELIADTSDPEKRAKWGTLFFLRAKEGTEFYERMAAWPVAFEEGMKEACRRFLPPGEYSIYAHGHSTGGPFAHILLQRVENVVGLAAGETSPFGAINAQKHGMKWQFPFNYLTIRTWRHIAKYTGAEVPPEAAWRLPWVMEDVLDAWDKVKPQPQFKAEYIIHYGNTEALAEAARVAAKRLGLNAEETEALVKRYQGYARELSGPGVKPVPPLLYGIAIGSRDHKLDRYERYVLPWAASLDPPARARVVLFHAGVHGYEKAEEGLPRGILPAFARMWDDAIKDGYYVQ